MASPASRSTATSRMLASASTSAASSSSVGGGFDDDSWGISFSKAATSSGVTSVASTISTLDMGPA